MKVYHVAALILMIGYGSGFVSGWHIAPETKTKIVFECLDDKEEMAQNAIDICIERGGVPILQKCPGFFGYYQCLGRCEFPPR